MQTRVLFTPSHVYTGRITLTRPDGSSEIRVISVGCGIDPKFAETELICALHRECAAHTQFRKDR